MNKIFFVNSAKFNYAEIDLRKKNIFFVGDNGSGKTTAIRAIHYYFNSDVKALGIDSNKRSFKDFYFSYPNSYIVYQFDEFFVLMYKTSGDVKKLFVRGEFKIDDLIENDNIVDYHKILYIYKENKITLVSTNEEFKRIIYGMNVKYEDLRVTTIKNYDTFIRLYNKIFNVNKAVFDIDSIKEVIKTTLSRESAVSIDYEEFFEKIKEYKNYFQFYNRFKKNEKRIDEAKNLKDELLKLNKKLSVLKSKIAYRKETEEFKLKDVLEEIKKTEANIERLDSLDGYFEKKAKKCLNKIEKTIFVLNRDLEEIEKLKSVFTLEKINEAKRKEVKYEELQEKLAEITASIRELEANIKDALSIVEDEIKELKREKRNLENIKKEKEITEFREIEEFFEEELKKLKADFKEKEIYLEQKEKEIKEKLFKENDKLNEVLKQKDEIYKKYRNKNSEINKIFEEKENNLKKEIKELKRKTDENEDEIYRLKKELGKKENILKEKLQDLKESFEKEKMIILKRIEFFKSVLETKEGSFKEFLNENVINWEVELYPVIDEELLSKSVNELKPKIVSDEIFGIELNKTALKKIPTMAQAEKEIGDLENKLRVLKEAFEEKQFIEEKTFEEAKIKINSEIEVLKNLNENIQKNIENKKQESNRLKDELKQEFLKLKKKQNEEIKLIDANITSQKEIIKALEDEKKEILNKYKILERELKNSAKELDRQKEIKKGEIKKRLDVWLIEEKKKIDKKIEIKENEKFNLTKDEKLKLLRIDERRVKEEINDTLKAAQFLKEYEEKKPFIEKEDEIKSTLYYYEKRKISFTEFSEDLIKRVKSKIYNLETLKKELIKTRDKIKKGLNRAKNIQTDNEKLKTDEFLLDLISKYLDFEDEFKYKKGSFHDILRKIKIDLEKFVIEGLEVNFVFELIEELNENELKKVDELFIFKEKKFETINKTMVESLKNLIEGILKREIDNFEGAKEDFIAQIKRVNKNLSKVDFGVIKEIKLEFDEAKRDVLKLFEEIKEKVIDLSEILDNKKSLFFDEKAAKKAIEEVEILFERIKNQINKESFSLSDVVELNLSFVENNEKHSTRVIKNESSTGGSILLKIAIAVSLLELFLKEKANLFLILDEVSVISAKNQELLRDYVNERGLGVIYVTPDLPVLGDVEAIDIYKFRNINGEFMVYRLINEAGIKFE